MAADAFINALLPVELQRPLPRSLFALVSLLGPLLLLAAVWHTPFLRTAPLGALLSQGLVLLRESALPWLHVIVGYTLLGLMLCPVTLLIAFTLLALGPTHGFVASSLYALAGSLVSASLSYWLGRIVGRVPLRYLSGPRMSKLRAELRRRAFRATIAARLLPLGNFTAINLLAGALYVPFGAFFRGNLVGLLPGISGSALFASQLEQSVREPSAGNLLLLLLCGIGVACGLLLLGRALGGQESQAPRGGQAPHGRRGRMSLVVASYNVHGCRGTDGRHDVPRIARVLRA